METHNGHKCIIPINIVVYIWLLDFWYGFLPTKEQQGQEIDLS